MPIVLYVFLFNITFSTNTIDDILISMQKVCRENLLLETKKFSQTMPDE